jgi:beta-carotene 3-hydroxylase
VDEGALEAYLRGMEGLIIPLAIVASTVAGMELVAWAVHKHVMHGWGWDWHRSHHAPRKGFLEKNDLYALVFAGISLLFFTLLTEAWAPFWWVGVGTVVYGLLYTLLHDGLVHRRIPFLRTPRSGYLKRLVQAHRLHHVAGEREGAVSFGFLYAPPVRELRRTMRKRGPGR